MIIPFQNVTSIDYKNMNMISVRDFQELLNSPERDKKLRALNNSYLSPQYRMAEFVRRDS